MGYFSRAIRADIEKGSRYFRRSDNTPFGRNAAAEVSMTADKRGHGFHLSTIREKFTYISIRRQQATALQKKSKYSQKKKQKCTLHPVSARTSQFPHPNLNREIRHSLTWHSSESESALERFEPVAVAKLWRDGRGILFALVAARRQGEIYKRWNASYMTFGTFGHTKVR